MVEKRTPEERDEEAGRRIARRLGLPERDVAAPDVLADLGFRVVVDHRVPFPRAPLRRVALGPEPELGVEEWKRYPLEQDVPPRAGDVSWETDVALGLDEPVHVRHAEREKRRRDRCGSA